MKAFSSPIISYTPGTHISSLDGLRGIAIVLLLLYHCFPDLYKIGIGLGWIGVDLFLVLSGFLITGSLLDSKGKASYLRHFFTSRALRILPLYILFLTGFFIILPLFTTTAWIHSYRFYYDHSWWYWVPVSNWLIVIQGHWPSVEKPILDHLWLLAGIVQFYLFWPFLVKWLNRNQLLYLSIYFIFQSLIIRIILVSIGAHYSTPYVCTFARMDAICVGALIALMIREERQRSFLSSFAPKMLWGSLLSIVVVIVLSRSLSLKDENFIRFGYSAIAVLFGAVLIYVLSKKNAIHLVVENSIFKWFGNFSAGIYLFHWFLFPLLAGKLNRALSFLSNSLLIGLVSSIICVALILGCALLSWHLLEKHFLKLKPSA